MGAFDEYSASARCPRCGDVHHVSGQTKAFDPDFFEHHNRYFVPGRPHPVGYPPSQMLSAPVWDDQWWRVREHPEPDHLALLLDLGRMFGCSCGRPLAPVLRFRLDDAARTVTLVEIELLDAIETDVATRVDLADGDLSVPWKPDSTAATDLHALATSSPEERAARLRRALADRFEGHERWLDPGNEEDDDWTHLLGPTRCEACGAVRDRFLSTSLTHPNYETPVLGQGWPGGTLRLGTRIASPMQWRTANEDRGYYMRLRPSPSPDTLTICGGPEHWGCGCGAGWASVIARFEVDDDGFTLASLTLRALKTPADLGDVDLAYAPACARGRLREPWTSWRPADRTEALAHLHRAWGLTPS